MFLGKHKFIAFRLFWSCPSGVIEPRKISRFFFSFYCKVGPQLSNNILRGGIMFCFFFLGFELRMFSSFQQVCKLFVSIVSVVCLSFLLVCFCHFPKFPLVDHDTR